MPPPNNRSAPCHTLPPPPPPQQPQPPQPSAAASTALCRSTLCRRASHLHHSKRASGENTNMTPRVSLVLCAGRKATAVGLRKILNLFWPIRFRTITIHTSTSTSYFLPRVGQPSHLEGLLHKPSKCPRPTTAAPLAQRRPQWLRLRSV